jgi:hypothetical protein
MQTVLGMLYYMLPGIAVGLAVAFGVVTSFRTQRKWLISLIWIGIASLAALISRWGCEQDNCRTDCLLRLADAAPASRGSLKYFERRRL